MSTTTVKPIATTIKSWLQIKEMGYDIKNHELREHVKMFGLIDTICHLRLIFSSGTMREKKNWHNIVKEDGDIIMKAWDLWYGVVPTLQYYYDQKSGNLIDIRLKEMTRQKYDVLRGEAA